MLGFLYNQIILIHGKGIKTVMSLSISNALRYIDLLQCIPESVLSKISGTFITLAYMFGRMVSGSTLFKFSENLLQSMFSKKLFRLCGNGITSLTTGL